MYLSSPRVNIAEESVEDHRVQLQCKFDEMEGKYTEAKPRCTCPSYESNLHQVGEVQHQLPLNLMLVHFRPHLCSGYTDQHHFFLQKVKSSMITVIAVIRPNTFLLVSAFEPFISNLNNDCFNFTTRLSGSSRSRVTVLQQEDKKTEIQIQ